MYEVTIFFSEKEMALLLEKDGLECTEREEAYYKSLGFQVDASKNRITLIRYGITNTDQETVIRRLNTIIKQANLMYHFFSKTTKSILLIFFWI